MRAGRMRHKVSIERPTVTQDSTGSITNTWGEYASVWASVEPISGREYFSASQVQSNVSTRIRIRYLEGVTPKMRVLHGSTYYDIEAVITDNKSGIAEMQLMCVTRGAQGFRNG
jgi:SPP1 family predicted phage head-tail adaptor